MQINTHSNFIFIFKQILAIDFKRHMELKSFWNINTKRTIF